MQGVYEKCINVFLGTYGEKRPLIKSTRRWKDNIKTYLKYMGSKIVVYSIGGFWANFVKLVIKSSVTINFEEYRLLSSCGKQYTMVLIG
jgi:DUF2075 family protein